jgi:hypothetical protein
MSRSRSPRSSVWTASKWPACWPRRGSPANEEGRSPSPAQEGRLRYRRSVVQRATRLDRADGPAKGGHGSLFVFQIPLHGGRREYKKLVVGPPAKHFTGGQHSSGKRHTAFTATRHLRPHGIHGYQAQRHNCHDTPPRQALPSAKHCQAPSTASATQTGESDPSRIVELFRRRVVDTLLIAAALVGILAGLVTIVTGLATLARFFLNQKK